MSDFNDDGRSDAVVGEGARDVLWQGEELVGGTAEAGDRFGTALAVADIDCDDYTDVVVGTPLEDVGAHVDSGYVQVFPTNDLAADVSWTQGSPGVPGRADAGDRFGASLNTVAGAAERVLLVGVPDDVDHASGMVNVIPFGGGTPRAWVPGSGGVPAAGAAGSARASAGSTGARSSAPSTRVGGVGD
jgi:hypothetical protein